MRIAHRGVWQMLQQRLIRSRLEREREGGVIFLGSLNHTVWLCESALRYLSAYAPVWHSIGDDPFQCKSGPRGNPTNNKGHQVGWWSCSSQKICWHMRSAGRCSQPLCAMKPIAHLSWPHGASDSDGWDFFYGFILLKDEPFKKMYKNIVTDVLEDDTTLDSTMKCY